MRRRSTLLVAAVALLASGSSLVGGSPASAKHEDARNPRSLVVATDAGAVKGKSSGAVDYFLGVPFAAPPTGALRWQPPQPVRRWSGVRSATDYGPSCPQGGRTVVNEDCLNLNVYRPATSTAKRLPVLLWIHGGGFSSGSGDQFDGSLLAQTNNIVVVSINYRLGAFGFLDLPGLSEEGAGNYGLLDQVAALRWANRNIERFGGDSRRVTVAGLSAGGHSVCALLASPLTKGLINGAIIQSGGCPSHTVAEAQAAGHQFASDAGCGTAAEPATCLRNKSSAELLSSSAGFRGGILSGPLPTAGVPELPLAPMEAITTGRFHRVPVLMGSTRDEVRAWARPFSNATADQYEKSLTYLFGDRASAVLHAYPLTAYPGRYSVAYALGAVWTDASVFYGLGGCRYAGLATTISRYQPRTFLYRFDADAPTPPSTDPAAFDPAASHAADQSFLWPMPGSVYDGDKLRLSTEMVRYWGAFVRTGAPDAAGQATWPALDQAGVMDLRLGGSASMSREEFDAAQHCDLWNSIDYQWLDVDPDKLAQLVGVNNR